MESYASAKSPSHPLSHIKLGFGFGLLFAIAAIIFSFYYKLTTKPRLWTAQELTLFNGTDERRPILLGVLGSVFDVTKGRSHYGPGGGYHHFSGSFPQQIAQHDNEEPTNTHLSQFIYPTPSELYDISQRDASRAFVSGNFTEGGLTDSLHGLSSTEVNNVVEWRKFYHERYKFVGKLVGRYYDKEGSPTKYLKGVEAKAKRGAQLLEKQKIEEAKIPSCNSRWSDQEGGKVWCEAGYPRLVKRALESAMSGKASQRCACYKEEDLHRPGLEVYKGCDFLSKSCIV